MSPNLQNTEQIKILAVDDKPENLQVIKAYLNDAGYDVIIATSGESAIERAKKMLPDIILLDVFMPELDGFETCVRLKKEKITENIPVIFVTAATDSDKIEKGFSVGAVDYITKPLKRKELLARVKTHITLAQTNKILQLEVKNRTKNLKEEQHRASLLAQNLNVTLNSIGDAVISTDTKGFIVQANYRAEKLLKKNKTEIIGKRICEICNIKIDSTSTSDILINKALTTEKTYTKEGQKLIINQTEDYIIISETASPILDDNKNLLGAVWVFKDITEEYLLKKKYHEMALIVQSAANPIAMSNLSGIIIYANENFIKLWGYSSEKEVIGKHILDFWLISDKLDFIVQNLLNGQKVTQEAQAIKKNREIFDVLTSASAVYDDLGNPTGLMASSEDITEKKKAEKQLLKSQLTLRALIDTVPSVILVVNNKGIILEANDAFCKRINKEINEVKGRYVADLFTDRETIIKDLKDNETIFNTNLRYSKNELALKNKESKIIYVQQVKVLADEYIYGEPALIQYVTDITSLKEIQLNLEKTNQELLEALAIAQRSKELEIANNLLRNRETELQHKQKILSELNVQLQDNQEKTEQLNKELSKKNKLLIEQRDALENTLIELQQTQSQLIQSEKMASLGILVAGVAHEINNPLNYIMGGYVGLSNLLDDNLIETTNDKISLFLNAIKTGVDKAATIVKGLNQFSRNNEAYNEECYIPDIIDNTLVILNNKLKYRISIEKKYATDIVPIKGNVGKLHQVFLNVLNNAIQSIKEEGTIRISIANNKENIEIQITDTGEGISKENLNKITDPFFTTKPPGKGTGLGLSITYNIIKDHNGTINFQSNPNEGTIVSISLPLNNFENATE